MLRLSVGMLLAAGMVTALPVHAAPLPRYGLFVFSTLCWERESGDADGGRLILLRLPGSDSALMDYTGEGGLDEAPVQGLKIDDKSGRISFRYRSQYDTVTNRSDVDVTVEGVVTAQGFDEKGVDGKPHRMPRQLPPEKAISVCR